MASWMIKGYVSDSEDEWAGAELYEFRRPSKSQRVHLDSPHDVEPEINQEQLMTSQQLLLKGRTVTSPSDASPSIPTSFNGETGKNGAQEISTNSHADHGFHIGISNTATELELSLQRGLSLVRDVLASTQHDHISSPFSKDDDSPLSTPPDSPRLPITTQNSPRLQATSLAQQVEFDHVLGRTLRKRTINQMMPYTAEQAKYLKECAESGIRPVRLAKALSPVRQSNNQNHHESQFEDESQDRESPVLEPSGSNFDSFEARKHLQLPSSPLERDVFEYAARDELPDLDDLLPARKSIKKQRSTLTPHTRRRVDNEVSRRYDLPLSEDEQVLLPNTLEKGSTQKFEHESFPSPPMSISADSSSAPILSQNMTRESSPVALPTPLLSSAPRLRRRLIVEDDDSQSASEKDVVVSAITPQESSSEDEPNESTMVRVMQKKVRGVLPASWWSIDRAQKEIDDRRRDTARVQQRKGQQAGIAQRTVRSVPNQGEHLTADFFDGLVSDEESGSDTAEKHTDHNLVPLGGDEQLLSANTSIDLEAYEILDGDGFDPMIPARSRGQRMSPQHQDGSRYFYKPKSGRSAKGVFPSVRQSNSADSYRLKPHQKKRRSKCSPDVVHVLDAPDLQNSKHSSLPSFLRLAARQAKKRSAPIRTSVSEKHFRLETDKDTSDLLRVLKERPSLQRTPQQMSSNHPSDRTRGLQMNSPSVVHGKPSRSLSSRAYETGRLHLAIQKPASSTALSRSNNQPDATVKGQVIQAGWQENNALRLTRLRSLLPLTNRSGYGRFAVNHARPRAAQLEVVRPNTTRLTSNRLWSTAPRDRQPIAMSTLLQSDQEPIDKETMTTSSKRRKLRKQTPAPKEQLRQTTLVSSLPDSSALERMVGMSSPAVRSALEKEFKEHHGAWFQGSKTGISIANTGTQKHFHVFLDVLRSYLPMAIQVADHNRDIRELQYFLHRLIPNRRQIGNRGDIGDKTFDVLEYDVLVARNVFELHACLLNLAPGSWSRTSVLEMMVDFSFAHHQICLIALSAWVEIAMYHHADQSITQGLGQWMRSIVSQLIDRWMLAETDARREANKATHRVDQQVVRRVINLNRTQANQLLLRAIESLNNAIKDCVNSAEAGSFCDNKWYPELVNRLSSVDEMDSQVLRCLFRTAALHVDHHWLLPTDHDFLPMFTGLHKAIQTLTSSTCALSSELLYACIEAFFKVSSLVIKRELRSWENFVQPSSDDCLDMFISEPHLSTMKSFFYHFLLENETNSYFLELRVPVLLHWVRALIQCQEEDYPCGVLTTSIFRHEQESLSLRSLSSKFTSPDTHMEVSQVQSTLTDIRYATIMHIISDLHEQQDNPEAEWLIGGLDNSHAVRMLKIVFTTMKETWLSLNESPEQQDVYTILVHAALDQYQNYPRRDFAVEPWFLNSATFPQPRKQSLCELFGYRQKQDFNFDVEARELFDIEVKLAKRHNTIPKLELELVEVLRLDHRLLQEEPAISSDIQMRQSSFIVRILCERLTGDKPDDGAIRSMVLRVLADILEHLECRDYTSNGQRERNFIDIVLAILSAVRRSFWAYNETDREVIYDLTGTAFCLSTVLTDVLPECIISDVGHICDLAADAGTSQALCLLQTVMDGL